MVEKERKTMYAYRDFATGKTKRTRGKFAGWTEPTGLLSVRYAIFRNPRGEVLVPEYCLPPEVRCKLKESPHAT